MATAKQLAALKKARAARKRNLAKKKAPKRRAPTKVTRKRAKRRSAKSAATYVIFLVKVRAKDGKPYGRRYFYSAKTEGWDTLLKYATYHSKSVAERVARTHGKKAMQNLPVGWGVAIEKK